MSIDNLGLVPGSFLEVFSIKNLNKWKTKELVAHVNNTKLIADKTGGDSKYRCILSDGKYLVHCVIDSRCNAYLEANGFQKTSIISIRSYSNLMTQKRLLIIDDLSVIKLESEKLGSDLISIDDYYKQNPEDDYGRILLEEKKKIDAPATNKPMSASNNANVSHKPNPPPQVNKNIIPIEGLSPFQNTWTIRGRVTYKGDIRTWSNARGEGKLFNVNFLDESGEIRATAFNNEAEKYFNLIEEGKVYYISKARVVAAKAQFSRLDHRYELNLDRDSEVVECFESADIPKIKFNFTKLDRLKEHDNNTLVDVIGVLKTVNPVNQITSKSTGKPFDRRTITIVDDSNFAIDVTLWNNTAIEFSIPEGSVIAFKGAKTNDFGGRSLSLTPGSSMVANPEAPESYQLKGWYDNQGVNENFQTFKRESGNKTSISDRKTILQVQDERLGFNERPDYFTIKAIISYAKSENFSYPACTNEVQNSNSQSAQVNLCNRKVVQTGDVWRCEKCNITYNEPHYRYIFSCSIADPTGQIWVTLFDSDAERLLGKSADEVTRLYQSDKQAAYDVISTAIMKEYNFRIRAKQDTYNGESRVRYQVNGVSDVDYSAEIDHFTKTFDSIL